MKKGLSILLALAIVLSVFTILPVSVSAEISGDYEYTVLTDGTAEITGYTGTGGDIAIPTMLDSYSVTSIGNKAFYDCSSLTSVSIGSSVTTIGKRAFTYCSSLKQIKVDPDNKNFYDIDGVLFGKEYQYVQTIEISEDMNDQHSLGRYQKGTVLLAYPIGREDDAYTVPDGVDAIADSAFCGCLLSSIDFREGLKCICGDAFAESGNLLSVRFPSSLETIGDDAFRACPKLNSITLNEGIQLIGYDAFWYCTALKSVTLPVDFGTIAFNAFFIGQEYTADFEWVNLRAEIAGYNGTEAADYADRYGYTFRSLGALYAGEKKTDGEYAYRVLQDGTAEFIGYSGSSQEITIPDTLGGHMVTSLGSYALKNCSSVKKLDMCDNIRTIKGYAFNSASLEEINIRGIDVKLSRNAFKGCESLKRIVLYGSAFSGSFDNDLYTGLNGVTVRYKRHNYHYSLEGNTLTVWTNEDYIELRNFFTLHRWDPVQQKGITEYEINLDAVENIVIENGPKVICDYAFEEFANVVSISIPDSIISFGGYLRPDGSLLESGQEAFWGCQKLQEINVSKSNQMFRSEDGVLFSKDSGMLVKCPNGRIGTFCIPDGVKEIGREAFRLCKKLTEVVIPESVTKIDASAFLNCDKLMSLSIPDSVTEIGADAVGYLFSKAVGNYRMEGFEIIGKKGSEAETYANANGITFRESMTFVLGDADGDSEVTILDATAIQRNLASLPTQSFNATVADTDKDGEVTILDATAIQRHLAGLPTQAEGIGEPIA